MVAYFFAPAALVRHQGRARRVRWGFGNITNPPGDAKANDASPCADRGSAREWQQDRSALVLVRLVQKNTRPHVNHHTKFFTPIDPIQW